MKKTLLIAAVAGLLFTSCKENKKEEVLETAKVENAVATPPATNTEEDMIKEAQSKPLTNIALSETNFDFGKIKKGEKITSSLLIPFGLGCIVVDTPAFGLSKAFQVVVVKNHLSSFSYLFLLSPRHQRILLILVRSSP